MKISFIISKIIICLHFSLLSSYLLLVYLNPITMSKSHIFSNRAVDGLNLVNFLICAILTVSFLFTNYLNGFLKKWSYVALSISISVIGSLLIGLILDQYSYRNSLTSYFTWFLVPSFYLHDFFILLDLFPLANLEYTILFHIGAHLISILAAIYYLQENTHKVNFKSKGKRKLVWQVIEELD